MPPFDHKTYVCDQFWNTSDLEDRMFTPDPLHGALQNVQILCYLESSKMSRIYIIWRAPECQYYTSSGELQNVNITSHLESSRMSILYGIWRAPECLYYTLSGVLLIIPFRFTNFMVISVSSW